MLSLLVVAKNSELRSEYIDKICRENKIESFDKTVIVRDSSLKQNAGSIGIEEIKNIQKKLFLMPIRSPMKAIIIEDAQMLTVQAQNSLLKVLEEPPDRTIIILSAETEDVFIPTIISRCQVTVLDRVVVRDDKYKVSDVSGLFDIENQMSPGMALKIAETTARDKDKAIEWCENIIIMLRNKLVDTNMRADIMGENEAQTAVQINAGLIEKIRVFQSLRHQLKHTNINARFAIENALLQ